MFQEFDEFIFRRFCSSGNSREEILAPIDKNNFTKKAKSGITVVNYLQRTKNAKNAPTVIDKVEEEIHIIMHNICLTVIYKSALFPSSLASTYAFLKFKNIF